MVRTSFFFATCGKSDSVIPSRLLTGVHKLQDEPFEEIPACRADRLHQRYLAIAEMRMIYLDVCVAVAAIRHFETW